MKLTHILCAASVTGMALGAPKSKRASSFVWFGANEAGAEFGENNLPGVLGKDYIWPSTSSIQTLRNAGMNVFRIPFRMERLCPNGMSGGTDSTYLADMKSTVNFITQSGAYAILDPHNYGRYNGNIISSTSDFQAFWATVAQEFASNSNVIFDTNNEYNGMDQTLVLNLNQAAINGIRGAGATSQYIFAEGNSWTGAWTWTNINDNMKQLTDPEDKLVYQMHQYLDSDGSGTSANCVSSTIGQERVQSATQWLKNNNKKGFLGEFAGGANSVCQSAVQGMLSHMEQNSDVWLGASWWSAGPWWHDYMYSMEPPSGIAYNNYMSVLEPFFPGSGGPSPTTTTTAGPTTTTAHQTTTTTTPATTTSSGSGPTQTHWGQCGGNGWTGPTQCESPWTCNMQNEWYSQCL